MSFISAVGEQWHKSAFAEKIAKQLKQDSQVCQLFVGATNITTVANLIAAMAYSEQDSEHQDADFTDAVMLAILFDCFRLLIVKQAEHDNLNQAEHLIIQLAKLYANKTDLPQDDALVQIQGYINKLGQQLDELQTQRRQQHRSMGR